MATNEEIKTNKKNKIVKRKSIRSMTSQFPQSLVKYKLIPARTEYDIASTGLI